MLKRFVEINYDHSTWLSLLETAAINHEPYLIHEVYPDEEIYAIVGAASEATGIPIYELQMAFGEYMVPDLLLMYSKYIDPEWKTFGMLEFTEKRMHAGVRQEDARVRPPILTVEKKSDRELLITYNSERKMAGVAIGIIKGIAKYYREDDEISVSNLTAPDAENVMIKVERTVL